jgi:hypothetical protein
VGSGHAWQGLIIMGGDHAPPLISQRSLIVSHVSGDATVTRLPAYIRRDVHDKPTNVRVQKPCFKIVSLIIIIQRNIKKIEPSKKILSLNISFYFFLFFLSMIYVFFTMFIVL